MDQIRDERDSGGLKGGVYEINRILDIVWNVTHKLIRLLEIFV